MVFLATGVMGQGPERTGLLPRVLAAVFTRVETANQQGRRLTTPSRYEARRRASAPTRPL